MKKVWVVYGDNHDYDYNSQWLVGAYSSEALAEEAKERDVERWMGYSPRNKKDDLNYNIECVEIDTDNLGDA